MVSPWYAFTVCPSSSECFFADAVDDVSDVVDTATSSYLAWRDGCRSEGARTVEAHPVAESPTKPTRMGEDIVDIQRGPRRVFLDGYCRHSSQNSSGAYMPKINAEPYH